MKLEKKAPTNFGEVYTKSWVAGVKGGGSGVNVFIETKTPEIILDSIYFRGRIIKLETKPANDKLFIGRFLTKANTEINNITDEFETESLKENFPFQLAENECIVSYDVNGETKYYKLVNIKEKPMEALPMSAPPNKN